MLSKHAGLNALFVNEQSVSWQLMHSNSDVIRTWFFPIVPHIFGSVAPYKVTEGTSSAAAM
jgi:xanthosine utilization system XapX-like protein